MKTILQNNNIWTDNFTISPDCKLAYVFFLSTEEFINTGQNFMSTPNLVFPREIESMKIKLDGRPIYNEGFKRPGLFSEAVYESSNQSYVSSLNEMNLYPTSDPRRMFPPLFNAHVGTEQAIVLNFMKTTVDSKMGGNLKMELKANPVFASSFNVIFIGIYAYRVIAKFNPKNQKYDWEYRPLSG